MYYINGSGLKKKKKGGAGKISGPSFCVSQNLLQWMYYINGDRFKENHFWGPHHFMCHTK